MLTLEQYIIQVVWTRVSLCTTEDIAAVKQHLRPLIADPRSRVYLPPIKRELQSFRNGEQLLIFIAGIQMVRKANFVDNGC